jgi:hypothetical protein
MRLSAVLCALTFSTALSASIQLSSAPLIVSKFASAEACKADLQRRSDAVEAGATASWIDGKLRVDRSDPTQVWVESWWCDGVDQWLEIQRIIPTLPPPPLKHGQP